MKKDALSLMVECESCRESFDLSSDSSRVTHKREYKVDGRSIYLTYYDCPNCGNRHFVQIDDQRSIEMLKVNKEQFAHNAVLKSRGQKLRKKKVDQYKDTQKHLANYRMKLMEEFAGMEIYDEERNRSFDLRFSV